MRAFHSSETRKQKYVTRMEDHIRADELVRGIGFDRGLEPGKVRGCAVGCTIDEYDHRAYETELGIPEWIARVEDLLHESTSPDFRYEGDPLALAFLKNIRPGTDLSGTFFAHYALNLLGHITPFHPSRHTKSPWNEVAMEVYECRPTAYCRARARAIENAHNRLMDAYVRRLRRGSDGKPFVMECPELQAEFGTLQEQLQQSAVWEEYSPDHREAWAYYFRMVKRLATARTLTLTAPAVLTDVAWCLAMADMDPNRPYSTPLSHLVFDRLATGFLDLLKAVSSGAHQTLLDVADLVDADHEKFNFFATRVPADPECGTPGCALGWLALFLGLPNLEAASAYFGATDNTFYSRLRDAAPGWDQDAALCAKALRKYAHKYHPYPQ